MVHSLAQNMTSKAVSLDKLYPILGGHIYFQTLSAAVQLGLFDALETAGEMTRGDIAEHFKISPKAARILLLGCTALELTFKDGEKYFNSPEASAFLVRGTPSSLVPIVEWQHFINYRSMYHFHDSIRANRNVGLDLFEGTGPTLYERLAKVPKLEKIFQDAMQAISNRANPLLVQHVDFSPFRHVVDIGGGNGTNLISVARRYPHLRGTLFDSPSVCEIAAENIEKEKLQDRLTTSPGDCFQDPFPAGADCLIFAHFFTIWSEAKNQALLRKCYQTLPKGGSVVLFNMMQSNDETGPLSAALGSPYFLTLATGEGMLYTWNDYESWMRQAGFSSVRVQPLPHDHGAIVGIK